MLSNQTFNVIKPGKIYMIMKTITISILFILVLTGVFAHSGWGPLPVWAEYSYSISNLNKADTVYESHKPLPAEVPSGNLPLYEISTLLTDGVQLNDEVEAEDITFDSRAILVHYGIVNSEEAYVDDIPFNTSEVVALHGLMNDTIN
jgi:hypothetical protein